MTDVEVFAAQAAQRIARAMAKFAEELHELQVQHGTYKRPVLHVVQAEKARSADVISLDAWRHRDSDAE
ncbi:MAG: hypothetical protein AAGD04_00720 [Pseudomonadota bacterium]